ncbi:MAG TPA: Zn-dependent hydrolase [Gemmatimonadaceae bacterium]|nr:Zn-dependent hydrolase [Gemmatimonadaceae bacterium]
MHRREFGARLAAGLLLPRIRGSLGSLAGDFQRPAPRVDGARLNRHLTELSRFGANPQGGVTRLAYSDADRQAREYVLGLMRDAKLPPTIDAAGNIMASRPGRDSSLKPILFGSHIDSVPEGGNYDGDVGSMAAIEVAQTLGERGITTRHPLQVVIWQNEEGGLYGSRAVSGQLTPEELQNVSRSGKTIADGIAFLGGDVQRLATARRSKGDIAGYLELHIEQGGTLERDHIDIGIVEGIVGIKQWEVTVTGFANHAGTTPMDQRHDALLTAARFIEAVNRIVTSVPGRQVGTVGRIQALPGAPNVIPGQVICTLELRDLDAAKVDSLYASISAEATKIGAQNGTTFSFRLLHENVPAPSDPRVRALIADAARELGLTSRVMPSGAGHDAQAMATLAPMGMIFVPSISGISHAPKEFSKPADITNGANVLLETLLRVDEANWS